MVVVAPLAVASCSDDQAPGVDRDNQKPVITSRVLEPCPDGGPDATTPAAGCLDDDGNVVRA